MFAKLGAFVEKCVDNVIFIVVAALLIFFFIPFCISTLLRVSVVTSYLILLALVILVLGVLAFVAKLRNED